MTKNQNVVPNISTVNSTDNTLSILPFIAIFIAIVALIVCYLLYKKIELFNDNNTSIIDIESNISQFVKEQGEINTLYAKRFNSLMSQLNQLHFLIQEQNNLKNDTNDFLESSSSQKEKIEQNKSEQQIIKQPEQREMMPTSIFQTSVPVDSEINKLPPPLATINKKNDILNENNSKLNINQTKNLNKKKTVNIETTSDIIEISEDSDEEEEKN